MLIPSLESTRSWFGSATVLGWDCSHAWRCQVAVRWSRLAAAGAFGVTHLYSVASRLASAFSWKWHRCKSKQAQLCKCFFQPFVFMTFANIPLLKVSHSLTQIHSQWVPQVTRQRAWRQGWEKWAIFCDLLYLESWVTFRCYWPFSYPLLWYGCSRVSTFSWWVVSPLLTDLCIFKLLDMGLFWIHILWIISSFYELPVYPPMMSFEKRNFLILI